MKTVSTYQLTRKFGFSQEEIINILAMAGVEPEERGKRTKSYRAWPAQTASAYLKACRESQPLRKTRRRRKQAALPPRFDTQRRLAAQQRVLGREAKTEKASLASALLKISDGFRELAKYMESRGQ